MPKTILLSLVALTALVLLPDTAHAGYLDPGSGSTLVQGIIAALVGLKRFFARMFHPFLKNKD
ncbi:MAG: hypothetical protein IJU76_07505 [Desulfovibrionaceae bacterium]|nr:hypothetical protein [Desulfovibrionaceae bacterium]